MIEVDRPAIALFAVAKHFGSVRAVDGVDLAVDRGEIFGFLGPNGAGKSTTIHLLVDLLRPTAGRVEVFGRSPRLDGPALRARIGYLPGDLVMPPQRTARAYLEYLARLRGGRGREQIEPLAERFRVDLERQIKTMSTGNRQKVGVIQAVMHQPDLLILDEPTSGLDPLLQHEFHDLLIEVQGRGGTVFLSSHRLDEVEAVAGRVAIIREGKLVDIDTIARLRHEAGQRVELRFDSAVDSLAFERLDGVANVSVRATDDGGSLLTCSLHGEPDELLRVATRYRVTRWEATHRELEDLFLDRYRPDDDPTAEVEDDDNVETDAEAPARV